MTKLFEIPDVYMSNNAAGLVAARQLLLDAGARDPWMTGFPIVRLSRRPQPGDDLREIVEWTGLHRQDCGDGSAYDLRFDGSTPTLVRVLRDRGHILVREAWDKLNDERGIFANFTKVAILTTGFDLDYIWMLADHELWADLPPGEFSGKWRTEEEVLLDLVPCYSDGRSNQT